MIKEQSKLQQIAEDYFKTATEINKETLFNYLINNEWKIADNYEKSCHLEDIKCELEEREIEYDDKLLYDVLYRYEDKLGDTEEWRIILNNAIDWCLE